MILGLLVLLAIAYIAHATKPPRESFLRLLSPRPSKNTLRGFFQRLLPSSTPLTDLHYTDLTIAWLVRDLKSGQFYLGAFNNWFPLGALGAETIEMGSSSSRSSKNHNNNNNSNSIVFDDKIGREANELKANGNYAQAALLYEQHAKSLKSADESYEAGEQYEEAAKCRKMQGDLDGYERLIYEAAGCFAKRARWSRAASICDRLAEYLRAEADKRDGDVSLMKRARTAYNQAQQLYEADDDRRALAAAQEICHLDARLGAFKEASDGFECIGRDLYLKDAILVNQSQRLLFFAALSILPLDQILFMRRSQELFTTYSWFAASREGKWAYHLGQVIADHAAYTEEDLQTVIDRLDHDWSMLASMPNWVTRSWHDCRRSLKEGGQDDLT